jgi:hypothetical protein
MRIQFKKEETKEPVKEVPVPVPAAKKQEEPKQEETERKVLVVREIPRVEVRVMRDDKTGEEFDLITIEEALTRIMND